MHKFSVFSNTANFYVVLLMFSNALKMIRIHHNMSES